MSDLPCPSASGGSISSGSMRGLAIEQTSKGKPHHEAAVTDFPRSLIEFQHRFRDDAACAA